MRGITSLVVDHILGWRNSFICLGLEPSNHLRKAVVLLLLMISISSSTLLGVAPIAGFSKVVESGGVVTPVRLRSRVLMVGLGRETTVRGGIHTCQRIWGEAGEALEEKFKCQQHRFHSRRHLNHDCNIRLTSSSWKSLAATKDSQKGGGLVQSSMASLTTWLQTTTHLVSIQHPICLSVVAHLVLGDLA